LRRIPPKRRALTILLIGIVFLGSLIVLDRMVIRPYLDDALGPTPDVPYYRNRTETVLHGGWLYRDINCESPPLIVYFMLPPELLGGQDWMYEMYFSAFTILTAVVLYLGLRRWDDFNAFIVGILFIFLPYGTIESTFGVQDESIVVLLFIVPLILAIHDRLRVSALAIAVGFWTKIFNLLFYPMLLIKTKSWRERLIHLGIMAVVSVIIVAPFLAVAPTEFISFPSYYFLGGESGPTGGISIWDFLSMGGLRIPGVVLLLMTAVSFLLAIWYAHKKRLGFWEGTLVVLIAVLIFYPRTAMGYFILPITLLLAWAVEDLRIAVRSFIIYLPFFGSLAFSKNNILGTPLIDVPWGWICGLTLTLIGTYLLVDTVRISLKKASFIASNEKDEEDNEQSAIDAHTKG